MEFNLIVANQTNKGIGKNGTIPWYVPEDLDYFSKLTRGAFDSDNIFDHTKKNVVIMGRKTWDSIPPKSKPLRDRINIIISKSGENRHPLETQDTLFFKEMDTLFSYLRQQYHKGNLGKIYIIGGHSIYKYFLDNISLDKIYVTNILSNHECDVTFPKINSGSHYYHLTQCSSLLTSCKGTNYQFMTYSKYPELDNMSYAYKPFPNLGEYQYLNLIHNIMNNGVKRGDRTGTGTRSIFGTQMKFDLEHSFPLLTTKRMFLRGIIEELLWFLQGKTDAGILQDKRVKIWDGNSSREYLDSIGLTDNRDGDCGPIYGHNFRYYGAKYVNCDTDYQGQGYDQVKECLRLIKEEPNSRRIMINLWNPCDLDKVALPPCHVLYQFYVDGDYLSCSLYQRSGDVGLGVPFNIASASIMTHIFAKLTGKRPKQLIHTIGDAHIYENHLQALKPQLERIPHPYPILNLADHGQEHVEDFKYEDFCLEGYECHPGIKMNMAV